MWKQINLPRLRGILVCIQGALKVAYSLSVTFNATRNTKQKTSKKADLFISTSLSIYASRPGFSVDRKIPEVPEAGGWRLFSDSSE
jgi:hypothetical protein